MMLKVYCLWTALGNNRVGCHIMCYESVSQSVVNSYSIIRNVGGMDDCLLVHLLDKCLSRVGMNYLKVFRGWIPSRFSLICVNILESIDMVCARDTILRLE